MAKLLLSVIFIFFFFAIIEANPQNSNADSLPIFKIQVNQENADFSNTQKSTKKTKFTTKYQCRKFDFS